MNRRLTKLVVFLLLGAIVNVAVAWGIAFEFETDAWFDHRVDLFTGRSHSFEFSIKRLELSASRLYIHLGGKMASNDSVSSINAAFSSAGLPTWVRAKRGRFPVAAVYEAHGWPCVALSSALYYDDDRKLTVVDRGVIAGKLLRHQWYLYRIPRVLPYGFIWPGFAINTAFYAVIVWMLWSSPFVVRRLIRRKRGLCIKCGYDLRGTEHEVCPECGVETTAKVVE